MTTYSNLGIALIGTGEESGTWGTVTNTNLQYALQEPIANSINVAVSGGGVTDTMTWNASSNASQPARFLRLNLTGSGGGTGNLVVPTLSGGKNYIINNASNSAITVKTASGSGILVPAGNSRSVYQDGTNVVLTSNYFTGTGDFGALSASGTVSGNGFVARFATPGPIGDGTPSTGAFTTGAFTTLTNTGNTTLGDAAGDSVIFNASTATIPNNLTLSGTGSITLPVGTTAQRPTPAVGMLRYNSTLSTAEQYAGSAWTGIPTTASITALIDAAVLAGKLALYPVGTIYTQAGVSTNPGSLLGFGTWEAFGTGRVLVGLDAGNALIDTLGETGGSANSPAVNTTTGSTAITIAQMPAHNHPNSAPDTSGGALNYLPASGIGQFSWGGGGLGGNYGINSQGGGQGHTHSVTNGTTTNANYQPFIVVYMWKRTA
jgi:hypothetical protein